MARFQLKVNLAYARWGDDRASTTLIVLAKFRRLEHEVELANEELKQERAMGEAAKRKAGRAKVVRRISEEKAKKKATYASILQCFYLNK
ncbi:hypothetical protein SO802_021287 [Lithocarpus litseifolius]|uniref:Uncharacterized protein n=1 Tax=Lithocarpus litseifolius TaxID=425828 RepID=A0AAW2CEI6_9ROSI